MTERITISMPDGTEAKIDRAAGGKGLRSAWIVAQILAGLGAPKAKPVAPSRQGTRGKSKIAGPRVVDSATARAAVKPRPKTAKR